MRGSQNLYLRSVQAFTFFPIGRYCGRTWVELGWLLVRVVEGLQKLVHAIEIAIDYVEVMNVCGS
jgi:hypothetical protein